MSRVLGGFAENQADFCHGFGVLCGFSPALSKGEASDLGKRPALRAFQANSTCKTAQKIQRLNQRTTPSCAFPNHAPSQPTSRALCAARFRTVSATSPKCPARRVRPRGVRPCPTRRARLIMNDNVTPSPERHRHESPAHQQNQHRARNPFAYRGARGAGPQPAERERRHPVGPAGRRVRRLGQREKLACPGRFVRRGLASLSGGAVHVHAPPHGAGRARRCRRGALRPRRPGAAPTPERPRRAQHLRHHVRAAEQPAPAVQPRGQPPVPALRHLRPALHVGGRRATDHVRDLRKDLLRARRRGACLQQRRRLPHLRRHRHRAARERGRAGPRREQNHQRGRRASLGKPDVGPHEAGVRRDGRTP